jgi:hypothetical protein
MTTAELVKKLMDAGANSDIVAICITAVEEARDPPPRRHRKKADGPKGEVVNLQR